MYFFVIMKICYYENLLLLFFCLPFSRHNIESYVEESRMKVCSPRNNKKIPYFNSGQYIQIDLQRVAKIEMCLRNLAKQVKVSYESV